MRSIAEGEPAASRPLEQLARMLEEAQHPAGRPPTGRGRRVDPWSRFRVTYVRRPRRMTVVVPQAGGVAR